MLKKISYIALVSLMVSGSVSYAAELTDDAHPEINASVTQKVDEIKAIADQETVIINRMQTEASSGNSQAMVMLGIAYLNGRITGQKEPLKALELFKKASDKNNGDGMFQMGLMFLTGNGVDKDVNAGHMWIKKGADAGSAMAQYFMGVSMRIDSHQAFEASAQNGNIMGIVATSLDYLNGNGVAKDLNKSYYWGAIALKMGIGRNMQDFQTMVLNIGSHLTGRDVLDKAVDKFVTDHKVVSQ